MKVEFDAEEVREILVLVGDRLIADAGLPEADRAALRKWRSESMRAGSQGMRELTAAVNADLNRALEAKRKRHVLKPDWR
jgi:hypothetical protein